MGQSQKQDAKHKVPTQMTEANFSFFQHHNSQKIMTYSSIVYGLLTRIRHRGATTAEKLKGTKVWVPTLGRLSQHWGDCDPRPAKGRAGCWVREGVAPSRCSEGPGISPRKIFENSDAKSCILVTTGCEIPCFLKTMAKKLEGPIHCWCTQPKSWGTSFPSLYGCCAYDTTANKKLTRR